MAITFALNLFERELYFFILFLSLKLEIGSPRLKLEFILSINFVWKSPNSLKPKGQHLKFGHFNSIISFMSHMENIPSPLSRSACSNLSKFIHANDIENKYMTLALFLLASFSLLYHFKLGLTTFVSLLSLSNTFDGDQPNLIVFQTFLLCILKK